MSGTPLAHASDFANDPRQWTAETMTHQYQRPPEARGLRLHLNENTAGCSPRVAAALRELTPEQAAFYPDYTGLAEGVAASFGVTPASVLLTNGLDEGILMSAIVALRGSRPECPFETIVVRPIIDVQHPNRV